MVDRQRKTLLLVEDEALIALLETQQLEGEGYRVLRAASGEEAFDLVCVQRQPVDLILMDINLGSGMDGTEAARQIQACLDVPIVFLSSHVEKEIVEKTEVLTSYGYVVKSGTPAVLLASVKMAFRLYEAQRGLRTSEERFRVMFQGAPDAMLLADAESGKILDVNQSAARLLRRSREEILGMHQSQLHPPQADDFSRGSFQRHVHEAMSQGETRPVEALVLRPDGSLAEVEVLAQVIDLDGQKILMGTFRDISERKRVEAQLQASERHFQALFESSPIGLWEEDFSAVQARFDELRAQGVSDFRTFLKANPGDVLNLCAKVAVLGINQHGLAMTGYRNMDELNGRLSPGYVAATLGQQTEQMTCLAEGKTHIKSEVPMTIGEDEFFFELDLQVMPGCEATLERVIVSVVDVTERRRAEQQIKALLFEKELFIKEVHHRVKNNMTTISSLLQLQLNAQPERAVRLALQDAASRVRSMMLLYDKIYRTESFSAVSIRSFVPDLLEEIVNLVSTGAPVQISTALEDIVLSPQVLSPLGIILNELTTNALKYAFAGTGAGRIHVSARRENGNVVVGFEDNGIGLPEAEELSRSSGFGMRLVGLLVRQINGKITIQREQGTAFRIEFPLE